MIEWLDPTTTIYRELNTTELRSSGTKSLKLPENTIGLFFAANANGANAAPSKVLKAGEEFKLQDGKLQLFRTGTLELALPALSFESQDGFVCHLLGRVSLGLDTGDTHALADFVREVAGTRTTVSYEELANFLAADLHQTLKKLIAAKPVESLHDKDLTAELEQAVYGGLRKPMLGSGLILNAVKRIAVEVPEYDKLQRDNAQALKQEIVAQQRQRMREVWEKDRRRELLSKAEIEAFMKALEHEGVVKELERKRVELAAKQSYEVAYVEYQKQQNDLHKAMEELELTRQLDIDRRKFEERLAQASRAYETLQGAGLEFFISTLEDEKEKAALYRQLMLKDMTTEQLAAMAQTDVTLAPMLEKVLRRIEELLARGADPKVFKTATTSFSVKTRAQRVMVVIGKRVLAYDPYDYRTVERPNEVYDLMGHNLGSLRSVRVDTWRGQVVILAGARQGVYVVPVDDPAAVREFAFFTDKVHKGGTNSAVVFGDTLIAAHSEQGLARWQLDNPSLLSVPCFNDLTPQFETVRNLVRGNDGVYFVAGGTINWFDPRRVGPAPQHVWNGGGREITGIVPTDDALYAGNRDGQLLRWNKAPSNTPTTLLTEPHAIYMLKHALIGGLPHLVYSSKSCGVTVKPLNNPSLAMRYECDTPIRWADAASDFVIGVSADQESVFIWSTTDPLHPIRRIRTNDKIQDVAIWLK